MNWFSRGGMTRGLPRESGAIVRLVIAIMKLGSMGGRERDCAGLVERFVARGHAVTVLTADAPPDLFGPDVTIRQVDCPGWTNHGRHDAFAALVARFRQQTRDVDAIIGFDRLPAADYIFATTGPHAERRLGWKAMLPRYRALLRQERETFGATGPYIFVLSEGQREAYRRHYDLQPRRCSVLPVTFGWQRPPPAVFYEGREAVRRGLGLAERETVLLHIAVNGRLKGLDRIIDALPGIAGARLLVVGDDSSAMQARARSRGVADRVRFLGYRDDVPALLAASDLTVHPARVENTGTVIVESLLYGVPVVASGDCGYAVHVARSGAGAVLATPFEAAEFLQVLRQAVEPGDLATLRDLARRYSPVLATEGGLDRVADTMLATIEARRQAARPPGAPSFREAVGEASRCDRVDDPVWTGAGLRDRFSHHRFPHHPRSLYRPGRPWPVS